jgi:1-acyl-sn-glycerol-3-phosphate acyltransferase
MFRSLLYAIAFYTVTAAMLLGLSWLLLAPRAWAMAGLKLHGRLATWLLDKIAGTKMEVRGREKLPSGPVLIVAKHQSAWDTFALIPLFDDPAIILKDELKWIPLYGWFAVKFEHILVKREKAAVALKAMVRDARDRVGDGRQILIFPEGTRTAPGAAPDYKPGYLALYEALDVPCVPLALNSGVFWPRRSLRRYPGTIVVEFLDPVMPGMPRKAAKADIETRLEAACARLLAEARGTSAAPGESVMTPPSNKEQTKNI